MMGIYKITNKENSKVYIGCSKNIKKRWYDHKSNSHNKNDNCYETKFYRAMRKYGTDGFTYEVLEECTEDIMYEREKYYIKKFNSTDDEFGYNISNGGDASGLDNSGENHANHKLTEQDVRDIRTLYAKKEMSSKEAYELYSERINWTGFSKIWNGYTWNKVMMDVYTEENKKWHKSKSCSRSGSNNRSSLLNESDVLDIRTRRNLGEERESIYADYKDKISRNGFGFVWNDVNWKHIKPTDK